MQIDAESILEEAFEYYPEDATYWVDFLRDAPEVMDDDDEDISIEPPKIYEEIPSFDFVKNKLYVFHL
ncbi:hypothetical protein ACLKA6_012725 [Drosophila palustris]